MFNLLYNKKGIKTNTYFYSSISITGSKFVILNEGGGVAPRSHRPARLSLALDGAVSRPVGFLNPKRRRTTCEISYVPHSVRLQRSYYLNDHVLHSKLLSCD